LNYHVSVQKNLADMDWVVAANFVVRHALVLAGILLVEEGVRYFVFQRNEALISI
jgi:3-deoxy-D-arabino-heptulosonate 7-phosphate (DAHP) synthase